MVSFFNRVIVLTSVVVIMTVTISTKADAKWQWTVISSGTFSGTGFSKDQNEAHTECQNNTEQEYIRLAQECCESTENDTTAVYGNRCNANYSGSENKRSFQGGSGSYFCWPKNHEEQFETGFWWVTADPTEWKCEELMKIPEPHAPEDNSDVGTPDPGSAPPPDGGATTPDIIDSDI